MIRVLLRDSQLTNDRIQIHLLIWHEEPIQMWHRRILVVTANPGEHVLIQLEKDIVSEEIWQHLNLSYRQLSIRITAVHPAQGHLAWLESNNLKNSSLCRGSVSHRPMHLATLSTTQGLQALPEWKKHMSTNITAIQVVSNIIRIPGLAKSLSNRAHFKCLPPTPL